MPGFMVTGAAGYIGSQLVPRLLAAGHRVVAVDTFWFGDPLPPSGDRLNRLALDVRHLEPEHFQGIDTLIDLAALSNDPCGEAFAEATWAINHRARVRTAMLARQAGVGHYLLASSCSVYGCAADLLDEHSPAGPLTTYARANLAAEQDILALRDHHFHVTALRLATLFGHAPRMRLDLVVNSMCYSAFRHAEITVSGGGTQVRPLLYVGDAADAMRRLAGLPAAQLNGEIINIGSNAFNLTIENLAAQIAGAFQQRGKRIALRHCGPQDLRSYRVNFDKLARLTGWIPSTAPTAQVERIVRFLESAGDAELARCFTLDWYRQQDIGLLTDLPGPSETAALSRT